jgi:predicted RNase H-like nuclease (RuvC/YqgF family)
MTTLIGGLISALLIILGYVVGIRKNDSEVRKNDADTAKSTAETKKIELDTRTEEIKFYDTLSKTMTEHNKRLLIQNEELIKTVHRLDDRIKALENTVEKMTCNNALTCDKKINIKAK